MTALAPASLRALAFLAECPATPLSHLLGGPGKLLAGGRPVQVTIYVTRKCNLRCIHCYIDAGSPLPDELTAAEWARAFRELAELGTEDLYILGGEPMTREDIYEIIRSASSLGMRVSMSTNGTLIGPAEARRLREAGLAEAQVSIDGPTREVNDAIRPPGSFDKAVRAVRLLKEQGIRTTIGYVVLPQNARYVEEMVELAESLGADGINFETVVTFGRAARAAIYLPRRLGLEVLRAIERAASRHSIPITLSSFRFFVDDLGAAYSEAKALVGSRPYRTCPAGLSRMVIDANGDVYGCELLMVPQLREGNVRRDSLRDIWERGFRAFRERDPADIEVCSSCSMRDLCWAGCPARALASYGTLSAPDPACPLVQAAKLKAGPGAR